MTIPAAKRSRSAASPPIDAHADPSNLSVRDLVSLLTQLEDTLRSTPFLIPRHEMMVVNPEVAPLLARQRAVVAQLRARRVSLRGGDSASRRSSAAWPLPPWS
jgi:hypothetical protein